jgi:seipin
MDADDPSVAAASSSSPTSDDTFFDALDFLPTPSPSPPPPHNPSSTLRCRTRRAKSLKQHEPILSPSPSASAATSTVTAVDDEPPLKPYSSSEATSPPPALPDEEAQEKDQDKHVEAEPRAPTRTPEPGILEYLAMLVIKAVVFQINALISCLSFPVRLLQWWFLFVTDPLGLARRARAWALGVAGEAAGVVTTRLVGGEGMGKVSQRLVWGSIWAAYVCVVLFALLIMAFLGGGLLVGRMVEEPVQVTETLNFDYTKPSPAAFVPVPRLVQPNQKMQLEVSLTLPESDYNRRLGVFQVYSLLVHVKVPFSDKSL